MMESTTASHHVGRGVSFPAFPFYFLRNDAIHDNLFDYDIDHQNHDDRDPEAGVFFNEVPKYSMLPGVVEACVNTDILFLFVIIVLFLLINFTQYRDYDLGLNLLTRVQLFARNGWLVNSMECV